MRESRQHKAESRRRITEAAAVLFRGKGIDAVGVDAVMRAAGLTHGGFYGHFASKEALAAEACAEALGRSAARWDAIRQGEGRGAALARIVESYLSEEHLAAAEQGCVLAALGPELARKSEARPGVTSAVRSMIETLARCLPGRREAARRRALAALSCMVGAMVLARLSDDPLLSAEFLASAKEAVLGRRGRSPARAQTQI